MFFLFQLVMIFTIVTGDGSCLHSTWQAYKFDVINPYNLFLMIAIMLFSWFLYLTAKIFLQPFSSRWLFVLVGSLCFYFWFDVLYALWWLFEMEREVISANEFFQIINMSTEQLEYMSIMKMEPHKCNITSP